MAFCGKKCVGICTDGAKAITGNHSGVVTHVEAVSPCAAWVHCSIHREALATKGMLGHLKEVLDDAVRIVHFVKARPLNFHLFSALCNEMAATTSHCYSIQMFADCPGERY